MIINLLNRLVRIQAHKDGKLVHQVLLPSRVPFTLEIHHVDQHITLDDGTILRSTREECTSTLPKLVHGTVYLTTLDVQNSLKRPDVISIGRQSKSLVTSFISNY